MRWTDGERGPSFKKSEINRHLPKIEVRHMRKASDPKAPSPLPSFVVRTYQLGSLEFLPLSSTLSAADARRRRPFAHLLKVSWVLSGSSWSTKMDSVRVSRRNSIKIPIFCILPALLRLHALRSTTTTAPSGLSPAAPRSLNGEGPSWNFAAADLPWT